MFFVLCGIQFEHSKSASCWPSTRIVDFEDGRGARYEKRRNGANVFIMSKKEEKSKLDWQRVLNDSLLKKKEMVWYVDAQKRLFICVAKFVVVAVLRGYSGISRLVSMQPA